MTGARVAVVGGLVMILLAFSVGTEHQRSTHVAGRAHPCGAAISASWLVSGTPDAARTADSRRGEAVACGRVIRQSRVVLLTTMGMGGLLALVGWTRILARREVDRSETAPAHA
ncbi:hypothetical protein [Nocardioides sp. Soil777]|uniref:hypothetical protein n=1 Tax=Nocardioides sp. Soil777 TaxID=1736409 RepID=UPI0012FAD7D3|nr:hypothetical protein [Nocardioides sp. Soil777]